MSVTRQRAACQTNTWTFSRLCTSQVVKCAVDKVGRGARTFLTMPLRPTATASVYTLKLEPKRSRKRFSAAPKSLPSRPACGTCSRDTLVQALASRALYKQVLLDIWPGKWMLAFRFVGGIERGFYTQSMACVQNSVQRAHVGPAAAHGLAQPLAYAEAAQLDQRRHATPRHGSTPATAPCAASVQARVITCCHASDNNNGPRIDAGIMYFVDGGCHVMSTVTAPCRHPAGWR